MAPPPRTEEETFLDQVAAFHEARGTTFDRDPKVSGRPVKLLALYNAVLREGGYDELSAERMRWRHVAKEFGLGNHHEAAMTFQLKTIYYKYLAAYEIKSHWREEPPPPEIVENLTAKGGDIRKRTLENFHVPNPREPGPSSEQVGSAAAEAEDTQRTPKAKNTVETEDAGSGGRYPTRQLRQDPKKTQLYQPDVAPTRRTFSRATSSPQASPAPAQQHPPSSSSDPRNPNFTFDKYQPKQPMAMALRPVVTPGNNPEIFRQRVDAARSSGVNRPTFEAQQVLKHVPGVSMTGPNIYIRCLYGLRSEIPEEQDFALHHLVKVSFERGDKYKFEGFPQLAEALLEKALTVSTLIHGIKWKVSYEEDAGLQDGDVLNGAVGTAGLYERLQDLPVLADADYLEPADFSHQLVKLYEATLVMRNMVMLEENAMFLAKFALLRDFLLIALNLPKQVRLVEYRQYALEIAEQVTKFWVLDDDTVPVYQSLVKYLTSEDRGFILPAARAVIRIGMEDQKPNRLTGLPIPALRTLASYLLIDSDDELVLASLDLLYQYTALPENMNLVLTSEPSILRSMTPRLTKLLLHNAIGGEQRYKVKEAERLPPVTEIPVIPDDLFQYLQTLPEPERSTRWLRCCFEEAPNEDITQIAIWQAFQVRFQNVSTVAAADFIKNVSITFSTAQAQVINGPNPRFIIKGIRPRRAPVGLNGQPYHRCLWQAQMQNGHSQPLLGVPRRDYCGLWYSQAETLWAHMVKDHLTIPLRADGKFDAAAQGSYQCKWLECTKHAAAFERSALAAGIHMRLHVNNSPKASGVEATATGKATELFKDAEYTSHPFYTTITDEKGSPTGIPYMAILVLKNFARYAIRQRQNGQSGDTSIMDELLGNVQEQLWSTEVLHKTLRLELDQLISMAYKRDFVRRGDVVHDSVRHGGTS